MVMVPKESFDEVARISPASEQARVAPSETSQVPQNHGVYPNITEIWAAMLGPLDPEVQAHLGPLFSKHGLLNRPAGFRNP